MSDNYQDTALSERVHHRLWRLRRLVIHLVITLILAVSMSLILEQPNAPEVLETLIPAVVLVFIAHALWFSYQEAQRYIVQQESNREEAGLSEKPKRGVRMSLSDDGELIELPEAFDEKPKRMNAPQ
jgi:hypothetical protein